MAILRYAFCLALIALPFAMISQPGSYVLASDVWVKSQQDCAGYENCKKTLCRTRGAQSCTASYCNAKDCGSGGGTPGEDGEPTTQSP